MDGIELYRGIGGTYSPDVPLVDALLGDALSARGFAGTRRHEKCVFATTDREQAMDYAQDGTLFSVRPGEGATVTWVEGSGDLVLRFASWLGRARWGDARGLPRGAESFLRDLAGDVSTLETYLSLGRQKRLASALVEAFAAGLEIREARIENGRLPESLSGHSGEVWITGPCALEPAHEPAASAAP